MLGVYGGTFDPVHFGHLRTALEAKEKLGADSLRLLPCRSPPHRGVPGASPEQRLAMLELALHPMPAGFAIDQREMRRVGPSYMFDTLTSLRKEFPGSPLCLILGVDAFAKLPAWHRWQELFGLAHFAVLTRAGVGEPVWDGELPPFLRARQVTTAKELGSSLGGGIVSIEVTELAISATQIRQIIADGKDARFLLPDAVLDYIKRERLYAGR